MKTKIHQTLIIAPIVVLLVMASGCATTHRKLHNVEDGKVSYLEESWGFYGLTAYNCDVLSIDTWEAPPPKTWSNIRIDSFEISPGRHDIYIYCSTGTYTHGGEEHEESITLNFEEAHRYKVDYSFLRGDCMFVKDLTADQIVFDNGKCGWGDIFRK